jgi:DNA-binding NarL/FixJ family response regulator
VVQATTNLEADLASAIAAIQSGSVWAPESVILDHARHLQSLIDTPQVGDKGLSAREAQVLDWVTWGRSNKEIASLLAIKERTVKFHVSNILGKIGVGGRSELVQWGGPLTTVVRVGAIFCD